VPTPGNRHCDRRRSRGDARAGVEGVVIVRTIFPGPRPREAGLRGNRHDDPAKLGDVIVGVERQAGPPAAGPWPRSSSAWE